MAPDVVEKVYRRRLTWLCRASYKRKCKSFAKVYAILGKLERFTLTEAVEKTGMPRSTVYDALRYFLKVGMLERTKINGKTFAWQWVYPDSRPAAPKTPVDKVAEILQDPSTISWGGLTLKEALARLKAHEKSSGLEKNKVLMAILKKLTGPASGFQASKERGERRERKFPRLPLQTTRNRNGPPRGEFRPGPKVRRPRNCPRVTQLDWKDPRMNYVLRSRWPFWRDTMYWLRWSIGKYVPDHTLQTEISRRLAGMLLRGDKGAAPTVGIGVAFVMAIRRALAEGWVTTTRQLEYFANRLAHGLRKIPMKVSVNLDPRLAAYYLHRKLKGAVEVLKVTRMQYRAWRTEHTLRIPDVVVWGSITGGLAYGTAT